MQKLTALIARGCRVLVIDDLSTGYMKNLARWRDDPRLIFEKADITGNLPGVEGLAGNMKGATLTFILDKNLKVTKVVGHDAYIEKISGGNDDIAKVMKASATTDTLKVAVEDMLAVGPGKPVSPGDTWKRDTKLAVGPLGDFTLNAKYTLDEVKEVKNK